MKALRLRRWSSWHRTWSLILQHLRDRLCRAKFSAPRTNLPQCLHFHSSLSTSSKSCLGMLARPRVGADGQTQSQAGKHGRARVRDPFGVRAGTRDEMGGRVTSCVTASTVNGLTQR